MVELLIGDRVLLVDGRGCHRVHVVAEGDKVVDGAFQLAAQTWRELLFHYGAERDIDGRLVLRSERPAIGLKTAAFHPNFVPAGWSKPSELRQLLPHAKASA
jgi:hypothetical protein